MSDSSNLNNPNHDYDLVVIGGGVVGLAILRAAQIQHTQNNTCSTNTTTRNWRCAVLEQEDCVLSHASGHNSGIICTGVDAAPNTLERALIREANSLIRVYCTQHNIPTRPCGSLVCDWSWNNTTEGKKNKKKDTQHVEAAVDVVDDEDEDDVTDDDPLDKILLESHNAGDTHAKRLSSEEIHELEPYLAASSCLLRGGIHIPGEIVIDPWLYSISLLCHARENGATLYTNFTFDPELSWYDEESNSQSPYPWTIHPKPTPPNTTETPAATATTNANPILRAKVIVNAAGVWSDIIEQKTLQLQLQGNNNSSNTSKNKQRPHSKWNSRPRRGQYRIYSATATNTANSSGLLPPILTHPIQPVPTPRTKGIFVFASMYHHIVVGPTALDQESKTDVTMDPSVAQQLDTYVQRILPCLGQPSSNHKVIGNYVGIRPGSEHRDYQIHTYATQRWITVGGIRSTGLTASLGIGNYLVRLVQQIMDTDLNLESQQHATTAKFVVKTTPMPSIESLINQYQKKDNTAGTVLIHGHNYKVTHPLTQLGWSGVI